ncbi:choice-of-anchor H family protein [Aliiglaciecola litoralis]|uniref:GlyGly-CTERM sorting domain-containing protein n=1 Tax=Aliiglaciecola litoralis TaxID=582857 RepID=A0ABP3X2A3_9ALTE
MAHLTKFGLFFLIATQFGFLVQAANSETLSRISVTSTESQAGNTLAVVNKKGGVGEKRKQSLENSGASGASKLELHQAKQQATPLSKPFSADQRITPNDPDFWIYDASVSLNTDYDYDGYYSTFTLEFDADTVYVEAEVYARLYLARGEVFEEYHTTSLFWINGQSSDDSLIVKSELLSGFPPGDYELLIELYDGLDDQLVAVFDGFDDVDLTLLTLESMSYEEQETVVIVTEHGGSFGFLILLLVPMLLRKVNFKSRV